jgi:hypothetical protein
VIVIEEKLNLLLELNAPTKRCSMNRSISGVKESCLAWKSGENYGRKKIRNFIDKEVK